MKIYYFIEDATDSTAVSAIALSPKAFTLNSKSAVYCVDIDEDEIIPFCDTFGPVYIEELIKDKNAVFITGFKGLRYFIEDIVGDKYSNTLTALDTLNLIDKEKELRTFPEYNADNDEFVIDPEDKETFKRIRNGIIDIITASKFELPDDTE